MENRGQTAPEVKFYHQGRGLGAFFTREGIFLKLDGAPPGSMDPSKRAEFPGVESAKAANRPAGNESTWLRMIPVGLNPGVRLTAADPRVARANYLRGRDPRNWQTGVPIYGSVAYQEAYPGVDLKFYGQGVSLEYDIIVKPGADPGQVKFQLTGVAGLTVTPDGDLVMSLPGGKELRQQKPLVYQEIQGRRTPREGKFVLDQDNPGVVGFRVAAYDPRHSLVIDPILSYSTFLGGSGDEDAQCITLDQAGNAYLTGITNSPDFSPASFPGSSYQQSVAGKYDAFVVKLDPQGHLLYMTYLGGSEEDFAYSIAVDEEGLAYIAGQTWSSDFPVQNAFQTFDNVVCPKGFVTKLSYWGDQLIFSTYLGGDYFDAAVAIAVDHNQHAWVIGNTNSSDFPVKNAKFPSLTGDSDVFVTRFAPDGKSLNMSTYLGGTGSDNAGGIALDSQGNAYVSGTTNSQDFFTTPGVKFPKPPSDGYNAFVCKINSSGGFPYSTYLGGPGGDSDGQGIAVDSSKNVYVTGWTKSPQFPTTAGAFSQTYSNTGQAEVFVTKFDATAKSLVYSTFLGGSDGNHGNDAECAIAVDSQGRAYVTGETYTDKFPLKNEIQGFLGVSEAFVTRLNPSGSDLEYSTMLGGAAGREKGFGIAVNSLGEAHIAGGTMSSDFPLKNPARSDFVGPTEAFVAKLTEEELKIHEIAPWLIKPIHLNSKILTPIAIPSTPDFDATQINPATVTLAGAMAKTLRGKTKFKIKDDESRPVKRPGGLY